MYLRPIKITINNGHRTRDERFLLSKIKEILSFLPGDNWLRYLPLLTRVHFCCIWRIPYRYDVFMILLFLTYFI